MKSFPSTFNRGGNSAVSRGKASSANISSASIGYTHLDAISAKNLTMNTTLKRYLFSDTDASSYNRHIYVKNTPKDNNLESWGVKFENTAFIPSYVLKSMNTYNWIYKNATKTLFDEQKIENKVSTLAAAFTSVPSLFNPQYNVQAVGFTNNTPLLLDYMPNKAANRTYDSVNCNIERLVSDSNKAQSPLGQARYRLVDFLYCKDLGKVSNNHLITLRKFALPIGDHIFEYSGPQYAGGPLSFETPGDIGRLVSWFGTDDNKLEDICRYETQYTWKQMEAKIQDIQTDKENSENRGLLGKLINTAPGYAKYAKITGDGGNDIMSHVMGQFGSWIKTSNNDNNDAFRHVDNNKVWTPKNTIWDNNYPEGRLIMKQEFTLNFSYKLRAYENINPRAAMLDLLGNILETTYYRGRFWGGAVRGFGPPHNGAAWKKANALINNAWDKMGGFMAAIAAGTVDFSSIIGAISSMVDKAANLVMEAGKDAAEAVSNGTAGQKVAQKIGQLNKTFGLSDLLKGNLLNTLGRPAMYALDSMVSGDNFGPWHLTVGNPYNPIMAIGNLIMTNATVVHSGALGIDDFPSEIKVTCTLKAARSRDLEGIGRYYTKGLKPLYMAMAHNKTTEFYKGVKEGQSYEDIQEQMRKNQEVVNKRMQSGNIGSQADDLDQKMVYEEAYDSMQPPHATSDGRAGIYYFNDEDIHEACLSSKIGVKMAMLNGYSIFHSALSKDQVA